MKTSQSAPTSSRRKIRVMRRFYSEKFQQALVGSRDHVRLVRSTEQVVQAVQDAVRNDLRVVARSGGCCLKGSCRSGGAGVRRDRYVHDDRALIRRALGALPWSGRHTERSVSKVFPRGAWRWWLGRVPYIGMGGHVLGEGTAFLSRSWAWASTICTASKWCGGSVRNCAPCARTREQRIERLSCGGTHRRWRWQFGIVTRYWLKAPEGERCAGPLPQAPDSIVTFKGRVDWSGVGESEFNRLLSNYAAWLRARRATDTRSQALYGVC